MTEKVRLSPSIAKILLDKSPKHAYAAHRLLGGGERPEPSPSVLLGKAIDALSFFPDDSHVVRTVRGQEPNEGDIALSPKPYETAHAVARAVREAIEAKFGSSGHEGHKQLRVEWTNELGVDCSGCIDLYVGATIVELKSAHDVSDDGIVKAIEKYRYDLQMAAYIQAVSCLYGITDPTPLFLFAETEPPYDTRWITINDRMMLYGQLEWDRACDIWRNCLVVNEWPGRGNAILGPSQWADLAKNKRLAEEWLNKP